MSTSRVIPFYEAKVARSRNPRARWGSVAESLGGEVWPALQPSFKIKATDTVFTIGSCSARNVERHLATLGCRVPMMDFHVPAAEWSGRDNSAMNKYHPPAFRQSLTWTAQIHDRDGRVTWEDCEALAVDCGDGEFLDLDMNCAPVPRERFIERRQHIYDIFSTAFTADCLMLTPGLIEAWRDRKTGLYIHSTPTRKKTLSDPTRWELEILSYETCLADMLATIDMVRDRNPSVNVLVTTSPVPMEPTFSGEDITVANTYSKAVLRTACGAVVRQRPMADYYPSYEIVTLSFPAGVWKHDNLHVSSSMIGRIVGYMVDSYVEGVELAALRYQEARTFISAGAFLQAEQAAREVLAARPANAEARAILVDALLGQDRIKEAEAELKRLLELEPDRADSWLTLAVVVARSGKKRIGEALAHIETGLALPTFTVHGAVSVAELLRQHAPPETAIRQLLHVVTTFPLHPEAYAPLAKTLIDQGRTDEAMDYLLTAHDLPRVNATTRLMLARLLVDAGRTVEAKAVVLLVLDRKSDHEGARAMLGELQDALEPVGGPG